MLYRPQGNTPSVPQTAAELTFDSTSGTSLPVEIDFTRRIHGHSCSDQARRKKTRKAVRQTESPSKRCTSGCKSIGRLCGARSCRREEARVVGCGKSGDCDGGEEAVGEGEETSEEGSRIV